MSAARSDKSPAPAGRRPALCTAVDGGADASPTRRFLPSAAAGAESAWFVAALALASSVTFVLAFAPTGLWPLAPLSVMLVAWASVVHPRTDVTVAIVAIAWVPAWWWFHRWIGEVSLLGLPALVVYLSLWSGITAWVLRRALLDPRVGRLPPALTVAIAWIGVEALRAEVVFEGYPWYRLAHPLIEFAPLAQTADLCGVAVPAAIVAAVGGALLDLIRRRRRAVRSAAATVTFVLLAIGYGSWRLHEPVQANSQPHSVTILAIQTDLESTNKVRWTFERQQIDFDAFVRLTIDAVDDIRLRGIDVDLIAWPETMLPGFGLDAETEEMLRRERYAPGDRFTGSVRLMSRVLDRPMLLGSGAYIGLRAEEDKWKWDRHYNSAYLLHPNGDTERYDKLALTPFGEHMPYISAWPWLEARLMELGARGMRFDLDVGDAPVRLGLPTARGIVHLATPICFEDTVASLCRRLVWEQGSRRADVIVNLSNDGWFGSTHSGRWQHAQAARYRCIENRTPMVRVVNTGVSAAYDSLGRRRDIVNERGPSVGLGPGWLVATVALDSRRPLAARLGDAPVWAAVALTAVLLGATMRRRRRNAAVTERD